ncbi:unnamed protein product [Linum tenue]|uniref:Pirin-like protein n=1 Tax=Linum tenue TaxID=586396 RepID=A0AAV0H3P7_9ROSI|nr:unnamed protein product [Linum tenue]
MPDRENSCVVRESRQVVRKFLARPQHEGVGAIVRRSIGRFELKYFDPFLALDEFSGCHCASRVPRSSTQRSGFFSLKFPPFRLHFNPAMGLRAERLNFSVYSVFCPTGFETVTYMLQGSVLHEDFEGHKGTIAAGDLQWMTAGRGIVHSEMPAAQGTQKGLQLWINLSSKHKMIEPRYQEISSKDIAEASNDGVKVRVIAGEALGAKSPVYTRTPTMYLDFTLEPGARLQQPIPASWNAFVYVLDGEGGFGSGSKAVTALAHHLLLLSSGGGDGLEAWNKTAKPARFILVGGQPLGEPLAQLGPFVMNSEEEIDQAIDDFEKCVNGFEKARHWRSESGISLGF